MININIFWSNQNIMAIEVKGHSGYAVEGKDIVCSAVSTLTEALINGLVDLVGINDCFVIEEDTPYLKVELPKDLDVDKLRDSQLLLKNTVNALKNVRDSYSKFINIKEK